MSAPKPEPWFDGDDLVPRCGNQCHAYKRGTCGPYCELTWHETERYCMPQLRADYAELVTLRAKLAGQER